MSIEIGQSLLHYRIVDKLGEGGMGSVWRAQDTTLDREVAIKILPEMFAADSDRMTRFQREAKLLASLNHPSIAAVYGLHQAEGVHFLAMELVPGEDLARRLERGAFPLEDAIRVGRQIAEALESAHGQGVIHRDLKPANVVLTADGSAKVLDFGLAKTIEATSAQADPSASPTLTSAGTVAGVILGTAAYMSPEQAKGRMVDRRSDIWAFGATLFEMLTGRSPYRGETVSETLAEVLKGEPDWNALPSGTPPALRRLLERCLIKDPRWRLSDMGDVRIELKTAEDEVTQGTVASDGSTAPARSSRWLRPLAAIATLAVATAAWLALRPEPPVEPLRLEILLPEGQRISERPAISPDGNTVAYIAASGVDTPQLYIRRLSEFEPRPVGQAGGLGGPFFSPDGEWVGYNSRGALWKVPVEGGTATRLVDIPTFFGATWTIDGSIVYVPNLNDGLHRLAPGSSTPDQLTRPDGGPAGYAHIFPHALPDGRVLYTVWGEPEDSNFIVDLKTKKSVPIRGSRLTNQSVATYANGHLLVGDHAAGLVAAPVDLSSATVTGPARNVASGVFWYYSTHTSYAAVSSDGTLVYAPGDPRRRQLVWVDREGRSTPVVEDEATYYFPDLSHDGRRVVIAAGADVLVIDLERGTRNRLSAMKGDDLNFKPLWMPGDKRILFSSNRSGKWDLYTRNADGSGEAELLLDSESTEYPESFSPDGVLSMAVPNPETGLDIWTLEPGAAPEPFVVTDFVEWGSRFSPDGKLIAYSSNESGRYEIWVQAFPAGGERQIVSTEGGWSPTWSADGTRLYYSREGAIWVAQVESRSPPRFSRPALVFRGEFDEWNWNRFDVAHDGERFLMVEPQRGSVPDRLRVVIGWR